MIESHERALEIQQQLTDLVEEFASIVAREIPQSYERFRVYEYAHLKINIGLSDDYMTMDKGLTPYIEHLSEEFYEEE